jgi:hypothetical protein
MHPPGTFCWVDLATTDIGAAKAFYGPMLGWTTTDMGGPGSPYEMIHRGGNDVGGIYLLPESQRARGMPPHWIPYVCVADAAETMARVRAHGGEALVEPCPVGDAGVTGVLRDPQGAQLALWQPVNHPGAGALHEPGTMTWNELGTSDVPAALPFYAAVFGWGSRPMPMPDMTYHMLTLGEEQAGGAYQLEGPLAGIPPHWMTYFAVTDCDASAEQARSLGAEVHVEPTDIPEVGRFAMIRDPQGAAFCVITLKPM